MVTRFKVSRVEERTIDGIVFDSKGESKRYAQLKLAEKAGMIKDLRLQPEFPVLINGKPFCTYTPDFQYWDVTTGQMITEDVKSTGTARDAAYRLRKKAAELYYGIKITPFLMDWKGPRLTKRKRRVIKKNGPSRNWSR